jgi:hypothetical protein
MKSSLEVAKDGNRRPFKLQMWIATWPAVNLLEKRNSLRPKNTRKIRNIANGKTRGKMIQPYPWTKGLFEEMKL